MAITKTIFSRADMETNGREMFKYFQENAAEYFDKIGLVYNGYTAEIQMDWDDGRQTARFATNGDTFELMDCQDKTVLQFRRGFDPETTAFGCAYKTSKGLVIMRQNPKYGSYIIARDKSGEAIIAGYSPQHEDTAVLRDYVYFVQNIDTGTTLLKSYATGSYDNGTDYELILKDYVIAGGQTVFAPVVQAQSDALVDGLYFVPFTENLGTVGIIELGGKKYVYNGVFALEE